MRQRCLLIVTAGLLSIAAAASAGPEGDPKSILGTWKVVKIEVRGKSFDEKIKGLKAIITRDRLEYKDGDKSDGAFAYKLDPSKKPRWIDIAPLDEEGMPMKFSFGIYALDGDELKICHPDPGKDRSTAFTSKPDSILIILKREKP